MPYLVLQLTVVASVAVLLLGGCAGSKPSSFYVLTPLSSGSSQQNAAPERPIVIGIGPVELPPYLDRSQIVTRSDSNQLDLAEFHRWAEPLQGNVTRVLAEDLATLTPTDYIVIFPWDRSTPIDYQVTVTVTRFDGRLGGNSLLITRWSLFGGDGEQLLRRKSILSEVTGGEDYGAMVSAMNRTLAALSREIAAAIKTLIQQSSD